MLAMRTTACTTLTDDVADAHRTPSLALPRWLHDFADRNTHGYYAPRALSLTPMWPGFLINSLAFALGFWLLLRSLPFLRWLKRRRFAQCLACGYPIGSSAICTECGSAVTVIDSKQPG